MKYVLLMGLLAGTARLTTAQTPADTMITLARGYFETIAAISARPEAMLWNKALAGPVLLVEPVSRKVYANQPDREGLLKANAGVYTGELPRQVNIANTAAEWAGVRWTMLLLPLPAQKLERNKLMVHELFHRIQLALGFPASSPISDHLDTQEGRIYFRLELEALKAACRQPVSQRSPHLQQAVLFRHWRYALFPAAKEAEEALELNEGLAEFTGVYVSGIAASDTGYLPALVEGATTSYPSFSRSFAYLTGPLYGMLLADRQPGWPAALKDTDNFPGLLVKAYQLEIPALTKAPATAAAAYNAAKIRQEEEEREQQRLAKEKRYRALLVQGPLLEMPLSKNMRFSFNPNTLFPLGPEGTVYPTLTMTDDWGRLVVTGEARMKDWRQLYITLPAGTDCTNRVIKTPEWELTLKDGWKMMPGERAGDYKLEVGSQK